MTNKLGRQYLVAASCLVGALAVGCSLGYPGVLLQQLASNDSSIELDWDTASWIGSIHGIAGIPSLIMPVFIQQRGRRLGFVLACLINVIGWILSYTASSSTYILISESFNGFGAQCISAATSFSMSEMLSPQIRKVAMGLYLVMQTLGITLIQIAGNYLHWRTISLGVSVPLLLTAFAVCMWPESPSWLAYKGDFDKCAKDFTRLRGTGDSARTELEELILAQKESQSHDKQNKQDSLKKLCKTLKRRDFYLPNIHIFFSLLIVYWSGYIALMIYGSDILEIATQSKDAAFYGNVAFSSEMFICCIISTILMKYAQPKKLLLVFILSAIVCLLSASGVSYFQSVGLMSKYSNVCLYLLILFMFFISLIIPITLPVTAELMPVKHRGIAGPLHVIFPCILHTSALKSVPYMLKYLNLWGTLLVFATNATLCTLFAWKYIPETKGRTLQQLEDYYNYGNFDKCRRINTDTCLTVFIP